MSGKDTPVDRALEQLEGGQGVAHVEGEGTSSDIDVVDVDRLGVRIKRVRVHRGEAVDVDREAARLPQRIRSLGDPIEPVEVAPDLGGARLRSRPDRGGEYFEVDVERRHTDIRRTRVNADGEREESDWTMTREALHRLLGEASGPHADEE